MSKIRVNFSNLKQKVLNSPSSTLLLCKTGLDLSDTLESSSLLIDIDLSGTCKVWPG